MNNTILSNRQEFIEMALSSGTPPQMVESWLADDRKREVINALCAGVR